MKSSAVVNPNLGIYTDRTPLALSPKMLQDGMNFRIHEGKLSNLNLGWTRFAETVTLNGPVTLITDFILSTGNDKLIFGTATDLYQYNPIGEDVSFITPRYETGTAAASGTAVTGLGTSWSTNALAGDEICFTDAGIVDPAATWYEIESVTNDTALVLTSDAGTIAAHAYTIRRKFQGDASNVWVYDVFVNAGGSNENHWYATNGIDYPVRWDGSDTQVESMSALGFTCKTLRVYSNMMIYADVTQSGNRHSTDIINSDVGDPSDVSSGISEQFKVHGDEGEIHNMTPIGDALAIYSKYNVTLAQFVGGDLIFVFRQVIAGTGTIGLRSVADFGDYHHFLSFDVMYEFDGATIKETGQQVWRDLIRSQDPARRELVYHHFDDEHAELIWVLPLSTDAGVGVETAPPEKASVLHYLEDVGQQVKEKPYSRRSFPFTAIGYYVRQAGLTWDIISDTWAELNFRWNDQFFQAAFPLIIVGDANGKLYTLNSAQNADGDALESYVRFGRRPVFDGMIRGLITRVMPFAKSFNNTLNVTLYMSDHAEGSPTITDTQEFDLTLPEGTYFTSHYRRGRYAELQFGTAGPSEPWEISGYDINTRPGGRR